MVFDKVKIERALTKKGFQKDDKRDHNYFHYFTKEGKRTKISTKTSLSSKTKAIGQPLLGKMAKQCKLERDEFGDFVECYLSRESYESILLKKGYIP